MRIWVGLVLVAALAATAGAEPFDYYAYCRDMAESAGGSYSLEDNCRKREEQAKRDLAGRAIPSEVRQYCADMAESIGGSYSLMANCIKRELEAKKRLGY